MIGLIAATRRGEEHAAHLASAWPEARIYDGPPAAGIARAWGECEGLVVFLAAGAAVRLIAPLLFDKKRDPGVVCVDDAARFAIALAGGHGGGANELALRVAEVLGATPVVTTACDVLGYPALDSLGADLGFRVDPSNDIAAVGSVLVGGERINLFSDVKWPLPALPPNVVRAAHLEAPCLAVSDRIFDVPRPAIVYRPSTLVLGIGCNRGASSEEILALVDATLAKARLSPLSVGKVASVDVKKDEAGLLEAAAGRAWPADFYSAEELCEIEVPTPSESVRRAVGTASVAEAAVVASGGSIIVSKQKSRNVTVAVGRVCPRGRLYLVGTGPGGRSLVPAMAREALARCEVVVGLDRYVDQVRAFLRPGTRIETFGIGDESTRAELAVNEASSGAAVALVSGGDAGIYGMASPALELASDSIDVVSVPGITAAVAAASLLGAPLGHDHCSISLSDLLTPWEVIRRRIEAAAETDFAIVFYNPRSRGRDWQLEEARGILLVHRKPDTPAGIVTDAFRPGQRVEITTLGELDVERVGMTTTVVIGSSQTRVVNGRMVSPRGYP